MPTLDLEHVPTLRELYPQLNDEQLAEASDVLDRYVDLAARIAERIASDPAALARFRSLTASDKDRTIAIASSDPAKQ